MCIEACPTRALTMTNEYEIADDSRENLIWTKEQLLVPLVPGMEAPPHPMRLGDDEKDYYRLGAAGLTVGPRAPGMSGPGGPSGPAVFAGTPDASLSWGPREERHDERVERYELLEKHEEREKQNEEREERHEGLHELEDERSDGGEAT
jgi:hypothetical protein